MSSGPFNGFVRLRACGGSQFVVSRKTLQYTILHPVSKWDPYPIVKLDMDPDSVAVIVTFLRYGQNAIGTLHGELAYKVIRDATILGLSVSIEKVEAE